jgi:general secretion pathway protein H
MDTLFINKFTKHIFSNSFTCKKLGFTLIELIVVLFILSLTTAIILPSFWKTEEATIKSDARYIASTLRYINDNAISKKQKYVFTIDLDKNSWGFKSSQENRQITMSKGAELQNVVIPSLGEVSTGEVLLLFGPTGTEEPVLIHLKKNNYEYTVFFDHISGRAKIYPKKNL